MPDHSTSRVARVERALFQVAPRSFSLFVDAHEAIAMALAASAAAVRAPRASFAAPRACADRAGHLSHFPRARVSSAASRLGARPATPAPLACALRGSIRAGRLGSARGATVVAGASEDDGDWNDEPTVNVPISFFSILNLSPARASPASIEAAYTSVIQRELVEGFSNSCLAARADLVDAAAQVISDPELRAEHESDLKNGRLTPVPASQLGGALALMQEAGEHEAVIEYAPECLAAAKTRVARRDITLSAALAHCELSHNALTATPPGWARDASCWTSPARSWSPRPAAASPWNCRRPSI